MNWLRNLIGGRQLRTLLASWAGLFLLTSVWALSTPVIASPDEPSHIIRAASVARGEIIGQPTKLPWEKTVQVPESIADAQQWQSCFAFNPNAPASCIPPAPDSLTLTSAQTTAGLYNPTYYALVGWPSLFIEDGKAAIFAMRLVSGLIVSFLLAATFTLLLGFGRPRLATVGFIAAATPMVYFLAGSVSPNAIEIAGGAAFFVGLLRLTIGPRDGIRFGWTMALIALAGSLAVTSRSITPFWLVMLIVAVLIASPWKGVVEIARRWQTWTAAAIVAVVSVLSVVWVLVTGTLGAMGNYPGAGQVGPARAFVEMLIDRSLDAGLIGVFGWLDTPSPNFVYILWSAAALLIVLVSLIALRRRDLFSMVFMVALFFIAPAAIQAASVMKSGYIWQGRYTLIVFVCMILLAVILIGRTSTVLLPQGSATTLRRFDWWFAGLFAVGHAWAVAAAIRRYALGVQADWIDVLRSPSWLPPLGFLPWVLLAAAASIGLFLVGRSWVVAPAGAERPLAAGRSVSR